MNIIVLSGNIVANCIPFKTGTDRKFFIFTIANNKIHYNKNQEKIESTIYVDCVVSRDGLLNYTEKYALKGQHVTIAGALDIKKKNEGDKTFTNVRIIVDDIHFDINGKPLPKEVVEESPEDDLPF